MAENKLKPWQTEISEEQYMEGIKTEGTFAGYGYDKNLDKFYKTNLDHPEKKKAVAAKLAKRKAVHKKKADRVSGYRKKIAELREEVSKVRKESKEKGFKMGYNAGLRDSKPKASLQEKIAKKQAKIIEEQRKIEAMKKKVGTAKPAETESKLKLENRQSTDAKAGKKA